MKFECPYCESENIKVTKTKPDKNHIVRERYCNSCKRYFSTIEIYKKEHYNKLESQIKKLKKLINDIKF